MGPGILPHGEDAMSFQACAALVERGDSVRFRAVMAAPVQARRVLFALYAFNIEVARAPWVTKEPMIAEMRLQWWRDALEEVAGGGPVRRHEVVDELAAVLDADGARCLDALVAARRWDVYTDAFEDQAHFDEYLDATAGHLMWTAARLLGEAPEEAVRAFARASGIANLFHAIPALEARGRKPLLDGTVQGVAALADDGLAHWQQARAARRSVRGGASAALLSGWQSAPILRQAKRDPQRVAQGALGQSPFGEALRIAQVSLLGWWR